MRNLFCYWLLLLHFAGAAAIAAQPAIDWKRELDDRTFQKAEAEKRLIILDLEAVWCHWCHVMDEKTYSSQPVIDLIAKGYIPVRIDQDARPDLGNRYRDYGWPATIILDGKGRELEKLAGFVEPEEMRKILKDLSANPQPRSEVRKIEYSTQSSLAPDIRAELTKRFESSADRRLGGLTTTHKYLEQDTIEYAIKRAETDPALAAFVKTSLRNNEKLLDPVWGGMYQYSTHGDWDHPHFEKIAAKQADSLLLYSKAYGLWHDSHDLDVIEKVNSYLKNFLQDPVTGAFYTSQDADVVKGEHSADYFALPDAGRRARGIPAIDKNVYSSENGRIISALTEVYAATGEKNYLDEAEKAASWIVSNRSVPGGGFKHGENDVKGPYLCDSLFMGDALLKLYAVSGRRELLVRSMDAAKFILKNFSPAAGEAGFVTSKADGGVLQPRPLVSENIAAVRYLSLLSRYSGSDEFRNGAADAMRFIGAREIALENITEAGVILADDDFNGSPLHITTIGSKADAAALALFQASLKYPAPYKRTEWWDRSEGPMPNPDVQYPALPTAAAFVCTNRRCSLPIFKPEGVAETVRKLSGMKPAA